MNGRSVYGLAPSDNHCSPLHQEDPAPASPKPQPRRVAVPARDVVRQTTTQQQPRVPIVQRVKQPDVPARLKQKPKTVAFGATVNVSQTVERTKDPHPPPRPAPRIAITRGALSAVPRTTAALATMSLARVGVGADRSGGAGASRAAGASRHTGGPLAAIPTPQPTAAAGRDENRLPTGGEERKEQKENEDSAVARLEARVAQLEKDNEKFIEMWSKVATRLVELETRLDEEGIGGGGGGGSVRRERSSEEDEDARRPQYSSEEDGERAWNGARVKGRKTGGGYERQEYGSHGRNRYDDYGGGRGGGRGERRRTTTPPPVRQHTRHAVHHANDYFDEDNFGGGARASAPPTHRWKDDGPRRERQRVTPPGGGGARGRATSRKRADITPSRRRVTERVTMERVHHFDDTDESDGGGGGGYDGRYDEDSQQYPLTVYESEVVDSVDFQSVAQAKGRGGGGYGGGRQPPAHKYVVEEVSDSEDDLTRRKRLLRERLEARKK